MLSLFHLRINYIAISYDLVASDDIFFFLSLPKSAFLTDAYCLNELCNVGLKACREMSLYVNDLLVVKIYSSPFFPLIVTCSSSFFPFLFSWWSLIKTPALIEVDKKKKERRPIGEAVR